MKKALALCLAILMLTAALTAACAEGGKTIAIHQPVYHPYCTTIVDGATPVLEAAGYTVNTKYGDGTSDGQLSDVEDFIAMNVDGLIIFPWDSSAIKASLEQCKAANIPVFVVDNPIEDPELVISNIATDNYAAGVANAEQLIADLGGKGKIAILDTPANNSSLLREQGFSDTIKEKAPEIEVAAQFDYSADQVTAMTIMEDVAQVTPDISGVFVCNEDGAFGVVAALEAAGIMDSVKVYTVDGSANGVQMIKDGKITGIAAQQPKLMGELAAQKMIAYFGGETIEPSIPCDIMYLTKDNASEWAGY